METLASASQAAPSILPDLVALDASELAQAEARNLIVPWQDAGTTPEDWGGPNRSRQGGRAGGGLAGLPFAAQADLFAYDPQAYPAPPRSWTNLLTSNTAFLLPLGDPLATFTLAQYLSVGGRAAGRRRRTGARSRRPAGGVRPSTLQPAPAACCLFRRGSTRPAARRPRRWSRPDRRHACRVLGLRRRPGGGCPDDGSLADTRWAGTCFLLAWNWAAVPLRPRA